MEIQNPKPDLPDLAPLQITAQPEAATSVETSAAKPNGAKPKRRNPKDDPDYLVTNPASKLTTLNLKVFYLYLSNLNSRLKSIFTQDVFASFPAEDRARLMTLLPACDVDPANPGKPLDSLFRHNYYFDDCLAIFQDNLLNGAYLPKVDDIGTEGKPPASTSKKSKAQQIFDFDEDADLTSLSGDFSSDGFDEKPKKQNARKPKSNIPDAVMKKKNHPKKSSVEVPVVKRKMGRPRKHVAPVDLVEKDVAKDDFVDEHTVESKAARRRKPLKKSTALSEVQPVDSDDTVKPKATRNAEKSATKSDVELEPNAADLTATAAKPKRDSSKINSAISEDDDATPVNLEAAQTKVIVLDEVPEVIETACSPETKAGQSSRNASKSPSKNKNVQIETLVEPVAEVQLDPVAPHAPLEGLLDQVSFNIAGLKRPVLEKFEVPVDLNEFLAAGLPFEIEAQVDEFVLESVPVETAAPATSEAVVAGELIVVDVLETSQQELEQPASEIINVVDLPKPEIDDAPSLEQKSSVSPKPEIDDAPSLEQKSSGSPKRKSHPRWTYVLEDEPLNIFTTIEIMESRTRRKPSAPVVTAPPVKKKATISRSKKKATAENTPMDSWDGLPNAENVKVNGVGESQDVVVEQGVAGPVEAGFGDGSMKDLNGRESVEQQPTVENLKRKASEKKSKRLHSKKVKE